MNRGELRTTILRDLGEPSSPFWSADDVNDAINKAVEDITERTEWLEAKQTLTLAANERFFDLRSLTLQCLKVQRVYNQTLQNWIEPYSARLLDDQDRYWEETSGEPSKWFVRGLFTLEFYPKPDATTSIDLYYYALPAPMSLDTQTPGFPAEFQRLIVDFAIYDLQLQRLKMKPAGEAFNNYLSGIGRFKAWIRDRTTARRTLGGMVR